MDFAEFEAEGAGAARRALHMSDMLLDAAQCCLDVKAANDAQTLMQSARMLREMAEQLAHLTECASILNAKDPSERRN
jgi:hypothetical protein